MTATSDSVLLQQIEKITGYVFCHSNLFWPDATNIQQRRQTIWYMPTTKVSLILCKLTCPCFQDNKDIDLSMEDAAAAAAYNDNDDNATPLLPLEDVPDSSNVDTATDGTTVPINST